MSPSTRLGRLFGGIMSPANNNLGSRLGCKNGTQGRMEYYKKQNIKIIFDLETVRSTVCHRIRTPETDLMFSISKSHTNQVAVSAE